jgi:hypothetical protein
MAKGKVITKAEYRKRLKQLERDVVSTAKVQKEDTNADSWWNETRYYGVGNAVAHLSNMRASGYK